MIKGVAAYLTHTQPRPTMTKETRTNLINLMISLFVMPWVLIGPYYVFTVGLDALGAGSTGVSKAYDGGAMY